MTKTIFLLDMQSFFASVEQQKHGLSSSCPLVVSGDPSRPSGVILAACPLAKKAGVKNGERLREARLKCPHLTVVPPHMQDYLNYSVKITKLLESITDLVEPYSIDEQFMDVTGSSLLFGSAEETAHYAQQLITSTLGLRSRIGIGENKVLAKMACDIFAKKNESGIYTLSSSQVSSELWPLPIEKLFRAGGKMSHHLRMRGIQTIGDFANMKAETVRRLWGVHGQVLWMNARGVDYSPVSTETLQGRKAIGSGMTLPYEYVQIRDIHTVLLELCEEVCRRARKASLSGQTVSLGISSPRGGFHRQRTRQQATNVTMEMFDTVMGIFYEYWERIPVRRIHVSLSSLYADEYLQLNLFEEEKKQSSRHQLGFTMDALNDKYGTSSVIRASSLLDKAQAKERAARIGGHYK
ncbi:DNA polymerase IV [Alkalicoccus halolimnae]|uniref:DNA polymerase IV n=1 Tax=Alkalicoccus halolimnae TaxID=1667239 RepID=A0A5C7FFJ8_9BACI|nr:DNA polymerase IV [Alkalicoccus halolimnae]TXF81320.1 DNA polymerase IV [Alkalicoccus halolimnae]